ncbi:DMT family transporter [Aphanothece sacrum]|uniref:Membrane protein n=1 Tax=Aphanothece sacrum FPU1 TaxID=1920663 RepID=A0A401IIR4_APHSA|nr:DMT family transporter [Aphanothece sacrum]GBF81193.1 membrane protein [Aphanothece sacrum FPU1]GBF83458.1 membrane protein [Aphanothece sacrum FPU3]
MKAQLEYSPPSLGQKTPLIPFIALLIALLAIGFAPILVRFSIAEIGANATIFNRFWIAGLIFGIWNGVQTFGSKQASDETQNSSSETTSKAQQPYTLKTVVMLLLVGILLALIQLLWAYSLTQTTVASSVTILHGLRPLLTTLGGWLLFKNRYDSRFLIGMTIAILGAILLGFNDLSDSIDKFQGDLLSVLSAICSTLELLIMERLVVNFKTQTLMLWCCIIGSLGMLAVLLFTSLFTTSVHFFPISWQEWGVVISLAFFSQVIGHGLITYSLNYLSSGVVAVSMLLDPVISALFAWIILSEQVSIFNGLFCCIVLLGLYVSLSSKYAVKADVALSEPLLS